MRTEVPRGGEDERERGDWERLPGPQREDEHRDRQRDEADARDVLAERGGDRERDEARRRVGDEEPADRARVVDAPRQQAAEDAEGHDREELERRERVAAAVFERAREQELAEADPGDDQRRGEQPPSALPHSEADAGEEDRQQEKRERARGHGRTARIPNHQRLPAWSAQSESRPSANPSANGNAAEMTSPAQTTANVRLDHRPSGPHCRQTTMANASCRGRDRDHRQRLDPEHRRQRVVDDAVRHEGVAPAVPGVVPELEAVVEEDRALVDVRGQVVARGAQPEQQCCERGGRTGGEHRLAHQEMRTLHGPGSSIAPGGLTPVSRTTLFGR